MYLSAGYEINPHCRERPSCPRGRKEASAIRVMFIHASFRSNDFVVN